MRRRTALSALLAVSLTALSASAALRSYGVSQVRFHADGPAGMDIDGKSDELSVSEKDGVVKVRARLTNLKTGISLRDKHLRGYLNTDKYPVATLSVPRTALKVPAAGGKVESTATGDFTLHGQTRKVPFKYKASAKNTSYRVQGSIKIDIRDFGVEVPCYLGVCVKPEVDVRVRFHLLDS